VINIILIAVAGFAVMLACSLWAVTSYQHMTGITVGRVPAKDRTSGKKPRAAKGRPAGNHGGSGMMGRLEERLRRLCGVGPKMSSGYAPGRGWSGSSSPSPLRAYHYFQNFIASF
jgi:hypothetical protein